MKIAITLVPLTFILSPVVGGEGRERLNRYFLTFFWKGSPERFPRFLSERNRQ